MQLDSTTRGRMVGLAAGLALAWAGAAHALGDAEVDRAAGGATQSLRSVVAQLAADRFAGRNNDTPGSLAAQRYLIARLARIGPGLDSTRAGEDAYRQPFVRSGVRGTNLLALVPGSDLAEEYVVVGAHYDHLGSCDASPGGTVCNGATDNAAGVAAVLGVGEALRRLPGAPRRSVVLALWDAEEDGLVGSEHYVAEPLVPIADTVAYVNFDILGADLLPSLRDVSFAVAPETGGAALQEIVAQAVAKEGLGTRSLSYVFGQLRSDYASFAAASVPTVFFSDSTGACYHTTGDDVGLVDFPKLAVQARIGFRVVVDLAQAETPPVFVEPNAALATYDDAAAIAEVVRSGARDRFLLPSDARALLATVGADLEAILARGRASFGAPDAATVLDGALALIDVLTSLDCPRRLGTPRLPELTAGGPS